MRFVLSLLLILPIFAQTPPQAPPKGGGGGRAPRNLKVLTVEEERPTMMGMRTSLGVMCTHCHVAPDFASDENPKKLVARTMMSMVKEINAKFPDGKVHVTCYTCHRGQTTPEMQPAPAAPPAPPAQ
jgi:photosynthetic reaction center cytochrome c subunit